jgi:hypothetical protein
MSKILDAIDILGEARGCIECVWIAAGNLDRLEREDGEPLQTVIDVAHSKIHDAIAVINEYRNDMGDGPNPAVPAAKPVPPAARTKRKGK